MKRSEELRQRLEKAQENVAKRQATIERQKKQLEKKMDAARKLGCDPENDTSGMYAGGGSQNHDKYWAMCDVSSKQGEIKDSYKKLKELEQIAANWQEKLDKQLKIEATYEFEMPAIFQQCKEDLTKDWTDTDIKRREIMNQKRAELPWEEFRKLYSYSQELEYDKTDEEFQKANARDAELFIIDLYNRVKAVTGEVTDWRGIHYGGKALNGLVLGKQGTAKVETVLAGGYNIQRLHMRVLVHEVKR